MKRYFSTFILCYGVWILLAGVQPVELITGVIISAIIALIARNIFTYELNWKFPINLLLYIVWYVPIFLVELIKANIDVALRVLNPKMPINPGFVKVDSKITSKLGKLTLANSITLTPGTITIDDDDDGLYVHWIDIKGKNREEISYNISGKFEKVLGRIFQ
ncbi:MAG: Na+/H+ antiporter subunit E [Clostridiales bacterium]|nr:Na+/H+ antiporter subunit E [Clostridiales bacterium]